MVWSNWQGAAWRGAVVVVLICSGLAWTQAPVQQPGDPADRIMVVHENGRKIRCRVEETWQLPDGRVAHLLQALDTGERITIVDDQAAPLDPTIKSSKAMPKRIFAWGPGRQTPPEGSPIPPHLRTDPGVLITQSASPASGNQLASAGKPGDVQVMDFQKGATTDSTVVPVGATQSSGGVPIVQAGDPNDKAMPPIIQLGDLPPPLSVPAAPSTPTRAGVYVVPAAGVPNAPAAPVVNGMPTPAAPSVADSVPSAPAAAPTNVAQLPGIPNVSVTTPSAPPAPPANVNQVVPAVPSTPSAAPNTPATLAATPTNGTQAPAAPCANPPVYVVDDPSMKRPWRPGATIMDWLQNRNGTTVVTEIPGPSVSGTALQPAAPPGVMTGPTTQVIVDPKTVQTSAPEAEKKPWRPGERIVNFFTGRSQAPAPNVETANGIETKKPEMPPSLPKSEDDLKIQKAEDYLAQQNKQQDPAQQSKQQDKKLLEKIAAAPPGPFSTAMGAQPDVKKSDVPALPVSNGAASADKNAGSPPPLPGDVKSAVGPAVEKKDLWGLGSGDGVLPPSKSAVESVVKPADLGALPPATRVNDPLAMPERFVDKRGAVGPIGNADMMPGDPGMGGYPLGAQSVIASRAGMIGQVTYVPVPTVTVPQPFNPPTPPEPKMPSPPELNAYVNAFTPPPQPKGTQEYVPMQGMMPAQAMNPAMQQQMAMQQYMMQQQMMQQQMMQQQAMNPYAYRPNPYPPPVSQGPTMNFARQYQGPQAPNPVGPGPVMPAGYYAPMMPQQQPMMPQQQPQPVQLVGFQQPSPALSQVDQLIKVLRESPYPAQREWAAQSLTNFEWRTNPQIVPNLLQSASQDPAGSVRAGCVFSLGRMQAAIEPVYTTLNAMRNDSDPRVRQEVQQTLVRLGQTPSGN